MGLPHPFRQSRFDACGIRLAPRGTMVALSYLQAVMKSKPHPLVRRFADNAKRQGAATYAGDSFAVATRKDEKRVDERNRKHGRQ